MAKKKSNSQRNANQQKKENQVNEIKEVKEKAVLLIATALCALVNIMLMSVLLKYEKMTKGYKQKLILSAIWGTTGIIFNPR